MRGPVPIAVLTIALATSSAWSTPPMANDVPVKKEATKENTCPTSFSYNNASSGSTFVTFTSCDGTSSTSVTVPSNKTVKWGCTSSTDEVICMGDEVPCVVTVCQDGGCVTILSCGKQKLMVRAVSPDHAQLQRQRMRWAEHVTWTDEDAVFMQDYFAAHLGKQKKLTMLVRVEKDKDGNETEIHQWTDETPKVSVAVDGNMTLINAIDTAEDATGTSAE